MKEQSKPYSKAIRQKALRLMTTGATAWDLVEKLDISYSSAKMWRSAFLSGNFSVEPIREKHSKELRAKALLLFKAGKGYKAVASELSVPMYTVRDWHRAYLSHGLTSAPTKRASAMTAEEKEQVKALAEKGHSCQEIVEMTGFNFYPVRYALRKFKANKSTI